MKVVVELNDKEVDILKAYINYNAEFIKEMFPHWDCESWTIEEALRILAVQSAEKKLRI